MSDNLALYNAVRNTPPEAQKIIGGGRLKGFTDINPMYRIKALTEQFGACGFGWYYTLDEKWTEKVGEEVLCFANISLYIKDGNEWSKPIFGTGGSSLYTKESSGLRASDEGYKMAVTDAISVACKSLGIGADIYWSKDRTKYTTPDDEDVKPIYKPENKTPVTVSVTCTPEELSRRMVEISNIQKTLNVTAKDMKRVSEEMGSPTVKSMTSSEYEDFLIDLRNRLTVA